MTRTFLLACSVVGLTAASTAGQDWAEKMFRTTSHDFGVVARNAVAEYAFELENLYVDDIHIADVAITCGCTTPRIEKPLLKTYEHGAVIAKINTDRFLGDQSSTIVVTIDRPAFAQVRLQVKVHIRSDVEVSPPSVAFDNVDRGTAVEKAVMVTSTRHADWKILDVKSANAHLSGAAVERSRNGDYVVYDLRVRLDEQTPVGSLREYLTLVTNDATSSEVLVMVEAQVLPEVAVIPSPLMLGTTRPGNKIRRQIVVRARKPVQIRAIKTDCDCFQFEIPTDATPKTVYVIPFTFTAPTEPGAFVRMLRVQTNLPDTFGEVAAYALVKEQESE